MRARRPLSSYDSPCRDRGRDLWSRECKGEQSVMKERMVEVQIGLHGESSVELELFTRQLLALRIMGQSERARTSLLTREQAQRLRDALDEMIRGLDAAPPEEEAARPRAA